MRMRARALKDTSSGAAARVDWSRRAYPAGWTVQHTDNRAETAFSSAMRTCPTRFALSASTAGDIPDRAKAGRAARIRVRAKAASRLDGSSSHSWPKALAVALSRARGTPNRGRTSRTAGLSTTAAMAESPSMPLPRSRRRRKVSAWSSW